MACLDPLEHGTFNVVAVDDGGATIKSIRRPAEGMRRLLWSDGVPTLKAGDVIEATWMESGDVQVKRIVSPHVDS